MAFELPEVYKIVRQMNETLKDNEVEKAHTINCEKFIKHRFMNVTPDVYRSMVDGKVISSVEGRGRWLFVKLNSDILMLFSLEMGGRVLYHTSENTLPMNYNIKLDFKDGTYLTIGLYGLGFMKAVETSKLHLEYYPGQLGMSPLDEKFTYEEFKRIFEDRDKKIIKYVMLEQHKMAGLGNSYLNDILHRAYIHPKRKIASLKEDEKNRLYNVLKDVLSKSAALGGSDHEYDLFNNLGGYKQTMGSYMNGQPCPTCGTAIQKLNVLGSSSYVCEVCQKLE